MLKFLLLPFSLLYFLISSIRNTLFDLKIIKSKYFHNISVISIGNLAVGGTGKTPMTEYILNILKDRNIAVLSRGYKRKTKGFLYVTQEKKAIDVGDEPLQMAQKFPNNTIAVCENRETGISKLISQKKVECIILDDSFQHRKVIPKLSILLTEYNRPYYNDYFLPTGRLRDNKQEAHRANIIVITKSPKNIRPIEKSIWRQNLKIKPYQDIFFTTIKYDNIINVFESSNKNNKEYFKNFHILVFSGIANQHYFTNHVKQEINKNITILKFKDHKNYSQADIEKIIQNFNEIKNKNKIILTTEKDAVKIRNLSFDKKYEKYFYYQQIKTEFLFKKNNQKNSISKIFH